MTRTRRRRANGEASRSKILDAAAEIAGERGYEGSSINLVSARSGLPASSIYWHFKDKDELIAAVVERSFEQWIAALDARVEGPPDTTAEEWFDLAMQRIGAAIAEFPDYQRLGLLLILEQRPEEPTARRRFLAVRHTARDRTRRLYSALFPDLGADDVESLVQLTIALADGLFVAQEAGELALGDGFDLLATALLGVVDQLRAARSTTRQRRPAATRR